MARDNPGVPPRLNEGCGVAAGDAKGDADVVREGVEVAKRDGAERLSAGVAVVVSVKVVVG